MRRVILTCVGAAVVALAACDGNAIPLIAGLAGPGVGGSGLSITPSQKSLVVGGTVQLTTSLPATQATNILWSSRQPSVATVSSTGLVTAMATGSATIVANLASDTTSIGSATITVTP